MCIRDRSTMEGKPANNSMIGLMISRKVGVAISARKADAATPIGTAMTKAVSVTIRLPTMKERIPKTGGSETGYQSVVKMKLNGLVVPKIGRPSVNSRSMIKVRIITVI